MVNPDAHAIGSPTDGPGKKGPGTKEDGYLAYYEVWNSTTLWQIFLAKRPNSSIKLFESIFHQICEGIQNEDWDVVNPNPGSHGPYAHTKDGLWVGYDDEDIAREKVL